MILDRKINVITMFKSAFQLIQPFARQQPLSHLQKRFNVQDLRPKQANIKKTFKGFFKLREGGSMIGTGTINMNYVIKSGQN